ncbi:SDR family oxidoreductase [Paraburkholderia silvatlantica]|uniref:SDR family oxidoreductase n=1 Tax=Paraburkholderia silvatlantica TaxID=321895 RepID=UPI00375240CF
MSDNIDFRSTNVLVTGGSEGIGLGLAARFLAAGATVLVNGRNDAKLERAVAQHPGLKTFAGDMSVADERERFAAYVHEVMPELTVIIHSAGAQRRVSLAEDVAPWSESQAEIDILLSAPIHLNHLLIPLILRHRKPALVANVTSGGAYVPQPFAPVYSACKAALHSYTINLRFALAGTNVKVAEIVPPAIRTALGGPGATHGAPLDDFCDSIFAALSAGDVSEIGYGVTNGEEIQERLRIDRRLFEAFSGRFPVKKYV